MKRSKITGVFLSFVLLLYSGLAVIGGAGVAQAATFAGGSGTPSSPYIVDTAAQLNAVRNDLSASYELGANIDLSSHSNWTPIGTGASHFTGTFNGKGYVISSLTITSSASYVGLFGYSSGTIENIGLGNVNIRSSVTSSNVGGLVGRNAGSITDAYATGSVTGAGNGVVGGLVGYNYSGSIKDAYATGSVTGRSYSTVGGLVGYNHNGSITDAYATGSVTGGSSSNVGGLVGVVNGGTVTSSYTLQSPASRYGSGGSVKTLAAMEQKTTYSGWDFTSTWGIDQGNAPPYLQALPTPSVTFSPNGDASYATSASTKVTLSDAGTVISSVYAWTQAPETPPSSTTWTSFTSGDTISKTGGSGTWYLHVKATDNTGNVTDASSLSFALDNTPPTVTFGTNGNSSYATSASTTVTVTDSGSGVNASSLQYAWTQSSATPGASATWKTFSNGGTVSLADVSGLWYLHVKAADNVGNQAEEASSTFDLQQAAKTVVVTASPQSALANGTATSTVTAAVYGIYGYLDPGLSVTFKTTAGKLASPTTVTSSVYGTAQDTLSSTTSGNATVTATVGGVSGSTTVAFTAGAPASLTEQLNAQSVSSGATLTVTGAVYDTNSNPVSNATVDVSVGGGTAVSAPTGSAGTYSAQITVPTAAGSYSVNASVSGISQTKPLTVTAGSVKTVDLGASPGSVYDNGTAASTLTATAYDAYGNPVPKVQVTFSTNLGTLAKPTTVSTNGSGVATDTITSSTFGTARVTAASGAAMGAAYVSFTGVPGSTALNSITPTSGLTGTSLTLQGSGFGTVTGSVYFTQGTNTTKVTGGNWSDTSVTATVPSLSPGTVEAAVYNAHDGLLSNTLPFTLIGPPAKLTLSASPTSVTDNGTAASSLTATATDVNGQGVPGMTVSFGSSLGKLANPSVLMGANGVATDTITSTTAGTADVTVTMSTYGLSGTTHVTFATPPSSPPPSSSSPLPQPTVTDTEASGTIGTGGGTLKTANNSMVLAVPPGAFKGSVHIAATKLTGSIAPPAPSGSNMASAWSFNTGGIEPVHPVTVTFSYNLTKLDGKSPHRLGIYFYDPATKTWSWVGGKVNPKTHTITATISHLSTYGVLENTATFGDLRNVSWAVPSINILLGADMVNGVSQGIFDPSGHVTRAEFTKLLVEALGMAHTSTTTSFKDVAASAWYAPYVAAAHTAGLVNGVTTTSFKPDAVISRQQMAAMLARAMAKAGVAPQNGGYSFKDSSKIAPWARADIAQAMGAGLIKGFANGTFRPDGVATRAQAVVVIARFLHLIGKV